MPKNVKRTVNSRGDPVLPVFMSQAIVFPETLLDVTAFVKLFQLPEPVSGGTKYLVLKKENETGGPGKLWEVGTICLLEKRGEHYFLYGKSRAELLDLLHESTVLTANIKELEDIPTVEELTGAQMPILWGCVDSIRLLLKKWQEKIPAVDGVLYKKIGEQVNKIEASRRNKSTIYSLPWHVMVAFPDFFELKFKEEMLRTDKVIDRLLSIVEKLQQEISVSQYAESFADIYPVSHVEPESDKSV